MRFIAMLLVASGLCSANTVVFWQDGFPAVESEPVPRASLERALPGAAFQSLDELVRPDSLKGARLLVLPYGSAVPVDAWTRIETHLSAGGSLLVIGGRPLFVPVMREGSRFVPGRPQNTFSRRLGLQHIYEAPQHEFQRFAWDEKTPLAPAQIRARKAFVATDTDGIGFFFNGAGERIAAPVTVRDFADAGSPRFGARCVFLNFTPEAGYWSSDAGIALIRTAAGHALEGAQWLRLELLHAVVGEGEIPQVVVQVRNAWKQRHGEPLDGTVRVELLSGERVLDSAEVPCSGDTVAENVAFKRTLPPGLYLIRATYLRGGTPRAAFQTGFWSRDANVLASGPALGVSGDYFRLGGAPFLPFGTNYFTTDPHWQAFEEGGNAYIWDRDFAGMEKHGVTFVRTGIWGGNANFTDRATGGTEERFLRAVEAYLACAARRHIQVHFTFFAFDPQTIRRGAGERPVQLGPGANPYTDPVALQAQKNYIASVVRRFREVPFLSWDLINEPSFSNPQKLWRTVPNGDPTEFAAWNKWLDRRYGSVEKLADAWRAAPDELQFGSVPLPAPEDLDPQRYGAVNQVRAVDYNLFAQDAFSNWAAEMIAAIRATGSKQLVTVGQDEGGVSNRLLNQFYGGSGVAFTVNHTWWLDDALLWGSVAAKRPGMPNLIGETGVQPAWNVDGSWRWDEVTSLGLLERKLALGFAAANSGSLQWDWGHGDEFGIMRADGSNKIWVDLAGRIGEFAKRAAPYATRAVPPEIAIVLPQSLQLSVFNRYALEAQQKCVRALFHHARASAYVVGEYQMALAGTPKLILLPSPWVLTDEAWEAVLGKVRAGATLLLTGRFDADEHFRPRPRAGQLGVPYRPGLLDSREYVVRWPGHEERFSFSGDKITHLERGMLDSGESYFEKQYGEGRILYFALPLELSDNLAAIGAAYRFAIERAKVEVAYTTEVQDPGILIAPTRLDKGTLYVLTSESGAPAAVAFRDALSRKEFKGSLEPGRAAMLLVREDGEVAAAYNWK